MIVVLDYGISNLSSIANALEYVNAEVVITKEAAQLSKADKIILPGVGAFRDGMSNLQKQGLDKALYEEVVRNRKPLLGICLGMQLLCDKSYEFGEWKGLGFIHGEVKKFDIDDKLKVPHVGWNNVNLVHGHPVLQGIENDSNFYFVHSYYVECKDNSDSIGVCDYGGPFTAIIARHNIFATQFHPEKSQKNGLKLLKNFVNWRP